MIEIGKDFLVILLLIYIYIYIYICVCVCVCVCVRRRFYRGTMYGDILLWSTILIPL